MACVISGDTGIDKVQDGSIGTVDIANGAVTQAKLAQPLTLGTSQTAPVSSFSFTDIPSWAKRITMMLHAVSTTGTSLWVVQIGDSGGIEGSGYANAYGYFVNAAASVVTAATDGFRLPFTSSTVSIHGAITLVKLTDSANTWVVESSQFIHDTGSTICFTAGSKTLSGTLDRIILTQVGADTFDAGTVNIMYEG